MKGITLEELKNQEIENFLNKCAEKICEKGIKLIRRDKNMNSIHSMGLSILVVEEIICELTIEDYCKGPEEDKDRQGEEVWIFLKKVEEYRIYIKLKLDEDDCVVISFHEAEY